MAAAPRFRKRDASVEDAVRRIAAEEIGAAIAAIDGDLPAAAKVHRVRRQMKALRALLRLVQPAFEDFKKENRYFRNIARRLSGARDARVMLDTFDAITRRPDGLAPPRNLAIARERLALACAAQGDAVGLLAGVRDDLVAARKRARHWSLEEAGWAALAGGLARTYGNARRAMRRTLRTGDAHDSHEWRKGVKYHGAQARLLRAMKPGVLKDEAKLAARLGDILGERHDIDLFLDAMARAPARFGDIVTVTQLAGLARLRVARLDRRSRRLGELLFAGKPGRHVAQWRGYWKDWTA